MILSAACGGEQGDAALAEESTLSVPAASKAPTFTNVKRTSLTASWTAASGATGYTLWRIATGASNWTQVVSTRGLTYGDTGLAASTPYSYVVISFNSAGKGPYSPAASVITATNVGTGAAYLPTHLPGITGGGAMPSWTVNKLTAPPPNGVDDTAALQEAADTAYARGQVLVIPYSTREYRVFGPITLRTSVGGVGGMPTIHSYYTGWSKGVLVGASEMSNAWIYNLHVIGNYLPPGTFGHESSPGIDFDGATHVTVSGCIIENTQGDGVSTGLGMWNQRATTNVLVTGNTIRNPFRNGVALMFGDRWAVVNNIIDKQVNYVSGVDMEPGNLSTATASFTSDVEVAYNKFTMNNRTAGKNTSDGRAASAWQNQYSPKPGGVFYVHHNYGTFGTGMWMPNISYKGGNGDWGDPILLFSNVEGAAVPTP
jgi:hypothetical protein